MSERGAELLTRSVLVVGLVLATSIPFVWARSMPPRDAGTLPSAIVAASPLPTPTEGAQYARVAPDDRRLPEPAADIRPPQTRSARIGDLDRPTATVPKQLSIPGIDVEALIVAVGVTDDDMQIPSNVADVGWYRHGPAPGERGVAVLAAHVDSRDQGRGAFFDLRRIDIGSPVMVTDSAGHVQRFDVVARRAYNKAQMPAEQLFGRTGSPQLVLVTCGGEFDDEAGSYRDNVIIYARASGAPAHSQAHAADVPPRAV